MSISNTTALFTIATAIIIIISFDYKLGIWNQIISSEFYEEYENKDKLIKEASDNLKDLKKDTFISIVNSSPVILFDIVVYFLLKFLVLPKWFNIIEIDSYSIFIYIFAPIYCLVQIMEIMYSYNRDKQFIDEKSRIHYDRNLFVIITSIVVFAVLFNIDKYLEFETKNNVLNFLQIDSLSKNQDSIRFYFITFFLHYLLVKPITRFLVKLDDAIYTEKLRNIKTTSKSYVKMRNPFSPIGTIGWISSIVFLIVIIVLVCITKITYVSLGDFIIMVCLASMSANLCGQRSEYVRAVRCSVVKNGKIYYRNIDNVEKKWE